MIRKLVLILAGAVSCFAQARLVTGVGNFIHDVGDLDRSLHFYRDVLGMDAPRPAGDWQNTEGVLKLYDAEGGKFRVANAQIPGSPMRMELVEFQGVDRKPVQRRWGTAGGSVLMLTVADFVPVQERLKTAGVAMLVNMKKSCDGRGVIVADPDGFSVMIVERVGRASGVSSGKAPATSNFTGMRFGYLVSDDAVAKGPFASVGLRTVIHARTCRPIEEALMNSDGPASVVTIPGGFEVWLVKGKAEKPGTHVVVRPHDPGAAVLRLTVSDVDAAVQALGQAQVKVVSAGGAIQTLAPGGLRAAILGAPDDLLIQVLK